MAAFLLSNDQPIRIALFRQGGIWCDQYISSFDVFVTSRYNGDNECSPSFRCLLLMSGVASCVFA